MACGGQSRGRLPSLTNLAVHMNCGVHIIIVVGIGSRRCARGSIREGFVPKRFLCTYSFAGNRWWSKEPCVPLQECADFMDWVKCWCTGNANYTDWQESFAGKIFGIKDRGQDSRQILICGHYALAAMGSHGIGTKN